MKTQANKIFLLLLFLTLATSKIAWGQAVSGISGNWNGGVLVWGSTQPSLTNNITISAGTNINIITAVIIQGTLNVQGTLNINAGGSLTTSGTVDIQGTLNVNTGGGNLAITSASASALNIGGVSGTLNLGSTNFSVLGTTTIAGNGRLIDIIDNGVNTFGIIDITTPAAIFRVRPPSITASCNFGGSITNAGIFDTNNIAWQLGNTTTPVTVTNNSTAPFPDNTMFFSRGITGSGIIVGNVIIADGTSNGNVELRGNGTPLNSGNITINASQTLTNQLGTSPTGKRLIASPRNGTGTFDNRGVVEIAGAPGTTSPTYNFTDPDNVVIFNNNTAVIVTTYDNILFTGTGSNILAGGITVNGDFNIVSGTFNYGTASIEIKGNWANSGTTLGTGMITFSGANNDQTITGVAGFNNLTISKTGTPQTVSLANNVSVFAVLALTSGKVVLTGASNLTILNTGSITGASAANYIVTSGTGALIKTNSVGIPPFTFPVGDATRYQPVTLATTTTNSSVRFGASFPSVPAGNTIIGSWFISNLGVASDIIFNNPQGTSLPTMPTPASRIVQNNSGLWSVLTTSFIPPNYTALNFSFSTGVTVEFGIRTTITDFYSIAGGSYDNPTIWSNSSSGGTCAPCSPSGVENANVFIRHAVIVPLLVSGAIITSTTGIDINANATLTFTDTRTFQGLTGVAGDKIIITSPATLPTITITNTFATTAGTVIEFNGTAGITNIPTGFGVGGVGSANGYQNLTISGSGIKTLSGNTTINGSLNIGTPGATLATGNFNIDIKGSWANSGTFTQGTGTATVTFSGSNQQDITGLTTFNNLTINNTSVAGVNLNNGITVNGTLNFTVGKLITNGNEITLGASATTNGASPTNGYIVTSAGGKVSKLLVTAATSFPIGTANSYAPISINNNGTFGSVGVSVRPAGAPPITAANRVNLIWNIATSGATPPVIVFNWNAPADVTGGISPTNARVNRHNGTTWSALAGIPTISVNNASMTIPVGMGTDRDFAVFDPTSTCPTLLITTNTPPATVNTPYTFSVGTTSGTGISYAISPLLPVPLLFNTTTGTISGTPTTISTLITYTVTATQVGCLTATQIYTFAVSPAPITLATPITDIKFVPTPNKIVFSWSAVLGATGYEIRKATIFRPDNTLNWATARNVGNVLVLNDDIVYDAMAYYSVRAIGVGVSDWSGTVGILVSSSNDPATSLSTDINAQITLSPNPTTDSFIITNVTTSIISKENNISFDLIDITGKTIITTTTTQGLPYKMTLDKVTKGLYYVRIATKDRVIIKKIVKE